MPSQHALPLPAFSLGPNESLSPANFFTQASDLT